MNPKRSTPRHNIIKSVKCKDREHFKGSKRETVTYNGALIRLSADFSTGQKGMTRSIPSNEKQGPTTKTTLSSKVFIENGRQNKELTRPPPSAKG